MFSKLLLPSITVLLNWQLVTELVLKENMGKGYLCINFLRSSSEEINHLCVMNTAFERNGSGTSPPNTLNLKVLLVSFKELFLSHHFVHNEQLNRMIKVGYLYTD